MKYEIRKKNRWTLVSVEILISSIIFAVWATKKFSMGTFSGIVICFVSAFICGFLFFGVRIFRYIFSLAFSLLWGFLIWGFSSSMSKSHIIPWVAMAFVIIVSLALHKDYFDFESNRID